jgi:membrane-associated phospholipid phosphatase
MPLLALATITLIVFAVIAVAAWRYPRPVADVAAPDRPAVAAAESVGRQLQRHRRVLDLEQRLDPAAATGLALTVALAFAVVGGLAIGMLAYLMRSSATLVDLDAIVAQWGADHSGEISERGLELVTRLGDTVVVIGLAVVLAIAEYLRRPNRWIVVFLLVVIAGQNILTNAVKDVLDRARPSLNPITETLGPSFPSGHSATAAAFWAAAALVLGRGRGPLARALLAGGAAAIAVAVASSRVLLDVHWLSDVGAGLALGWAWFAVCAIAFGGRFLRFGAAVQVAERAAADQSGTGGSTRTTHASA